MLLLVYQRVPVRKKMSSNWAVTSVSEVLRWSDGLLFIPPPSLCFYQAVITAVTTTVMTRRQTCRLNIKTLARLLHRRRFNQSFLSVGGRVQVLSLWWAFSIISQCLCYIPQRCIIGFPYGRQRQIKRICQTRNQLRQTLCYPLSRSLCVCI